MEAEVLIYQKDGMGMWLLIGDARHEMEAMLIIGEMRGRMNGAGSFRVAAPKSLQTRQVLAYKNGKWEVEAKE